LHLLLERFEGAVRVHFADEFVHDTRADQTGADVTPPATGDEFDPNDRGLTRATQPGMTP
jgi:hypothetical protein